MMFYQISKSYRIEVVNDMFYPQVLYVYRDLKVVEWGHMFINHVKIACNSLYEAMQYIG